MSKQPESIYTRDNGTDVLRIPLTLGKVAIINAADAGLIAGRRWTAHRNGKHWYAYNRIEKGDTVERLMMHRLIIGPTDKPIVDHINGNTLDNRRANLRAVDASANVRNMHAIWGKSRFKGVHAHSASGKWSAGLHDKGRRIYLGLFSDEEEAAIAYDRAAFAHFGEYARPNFPRRLYAMIDAAISTDDMASRRSAMIDAALRGGA